MAKISRNGEGILNERVLGSETYLGILTLWIIMSKWPVIVHFLYQAINTE